MPWDCCGLAVLDSTATCPTCGKVKEAWTVEVDKTRQLVFERKRPKKQKLEVLRGVETHHCPAHDGPPVHALEPASFAPVLLGSIAGAYAALETFPPPAFLLTLRLWPGDAKGASVRLTFGYADDTIEELELTAPEEGLAPKQEYHEVSLLLVWGGRPGIAFPGVHVIDVSDDEQGHVPFATSLTVSAQALGLPPIELELHELLPEVELSEEDEDEAPTPEQPAAAG